MEVFTSTSRFSCQQRNLLRSMLDNGVFKFDFEGKGFELKSGKMSPIYIDLRECFGAPALMKLAADSLRSLIETSAAKFDAIVGVPYAALPYSTLVATDLVSPLIIIRKEAKSYGTKKLIEGKYSAGDTVIIVEDVVTTGGSIKTVVETLRADGLIVKDVYCLLDRDQGGADKLKEDGITLHSLLNMKQILSFLQSVSVVAADKFHLIVDALNLSYNQVGSFPITREAEDVNKLPFVDGSRLPLSERVIGAGSELKRRLFNLMQKKQSNLCIALDYTHSEEILELAEKAGPYVIAVKVHSDVITDFCAEFTKRLVSLADKHEFLVFEDRKFGDTGNTNLLQLKGSHNIAEWADIVTVHAVQGSDSIGSVFREVIQDENLRLKGVLLIAELSTKGSLTALPSYTENVVKIGEENADVVCGFICQNRVSGHADMLHWTPGVNLSAKTDKAGQQWRDVNQAIVAQQNDIVIVGRGVTASADPVQELHRYKEEAWRALNAN